MVIMYEKNNSLKLESKKGVKFKKKWNASDWLETTVMPVLGPITLFNIKCVGEPSPPEKLLVFFFCNYLK